MVSDSNDLLWVEVMSCTVRANLMDDIAYCVYIRTLNYGLIFVDSMFLSIDSSLLWMNVKPSVDVD